MFNQQEYEARLEVIKEHYKPLIIAKLNQIRELLIKHGFECDEPMYTEFEDHTWSFCANTPNALDSKGKVYIDIELCEELLFEGEPYDSDDFPGINFSFKVVEYGGRILTPFNYTPRVWVPLFDDDAIEKRWKLLLNADFGGLPKLIKGK